MKKFDEINIIPFIDIMLVLLAIVLITASFISQGKIAVNLPKANSEVRLTANDLAKLLIITANGQIFLSEQPITLEMLEQEISHWNKQQSVTLKVDASASFQHFVNLSELFAKYQIKNLSIVTLKEKGR